MEEESTGIISFSAQAEDHLEKQEIRSHNPFLSARYNVLFYARKEGENPWNKEDNP